MNKKAITYFVSAFIMISSVSVYFILREFELSEDSYVITDNYDNIWVTNEPDNGIYSLSTENTTSDSTQSSRGDDGSDDLYIDINTASEEELMQLKGIGKVIAGNIISYRESVGGFGSIEEIMNVKGIGEKTFLSLKENIYVKKSTDTSENNS